MIRPQHRKSIAFSTSEAIFRLLYFVVIAVLAFAASDALAGTTSNPSLNRKELFKAVQNTGWFEQGNPKAPHQIYVISEPNCSACHYLYTSIRPYIRSGALSVRWILVGFLKPSSVAKAAEIVSSTNPAKLFDRNEVNFNEQTESGGITPSATTFSVARNIIFRNTNFMKAHGFKETPTIICKRFDLI